MSEAGFSYEKDGAIAWFRLQRPEARNALTPRMICGMADAFLDFREDEALRVLILTGEGDQAFCAGGDLKSSLPLLTGDRPPADEWDHRLLDDPFVMQASALREFELDKPVIAALNGTCMAAGLELMLGTDLRIAVPGAKLALPEVRRGLVPFAGSMVRLPRQVGHARAMELMMIGEPITSEQALAMGLVNEIVPFEALQARALERARQIAANAPLAVRAIKRTAVQTGGMALPEAFSFEDAAAQEVLDSEDAREGPRAFMEKREPVYRGR
jgi:enoyl-CoA hydratase